MLIIELRIWRHTDPISAVSKFLFTHTYIDGLVLKPRWADRRVDIYEQIAQGEAGCTKLQSQKPVPAPCDHLDRHSLPFRNKNWGASEDGPMKLSSSFFFSFSNAWYRPAPYVLNKFLTAPSSAEFLVLEEDNAHPGTKYLIPESILESITWQIVSAVLHLSIKYSGN